MTNFPHYLRSGLVKNLKYFLFFFTVLSVESAKSQFKERTLRVNGNSQLIISGTSNVNDFTCKLVDMSAVKEITAEYIDQGPEILFHHTVVSFPVEDFECENKAMTEDFRKLLKYDEHENIMLEIHRASKKDEDNFEEVEAEIALQIAGESKKINTSFYDVAVHHGELSFQGNEKLNLTDFKLDPPKFFFGLIEIRDEIKIDLYLSLVEKKKAGLRPAFSDGKDNP